MTDAGDLAVGPPPITEELVRGLLIDQHPDLADQPLTLVDAGWDNVIFRLGNDLAVRLPSRVESVELVAHEHRWLPVLAPTLPLPVPDPVRLGAPSPRFAWPWTICRWFPGRPASVRPPDDPIRAAQVLGAFLVALHQPADPEAPANPYRGIPLTTRNDETMARIDQLADQLDRDAVRDCWARHASLPRWTGSPLWLHGDLHPANVIVDHGEVAAVIDFGDLTAGDPATDLAIGWILFDGASRRAFRDAASPDPAAWERGRGWALTLAVAYCASPISTPDFRRMGRRTIAAVLADDDLA